MGFKRDGLGWVGLDWVLVAFCVCARRCRKLCSVVEDVTEYLFSCQLRSFIASRIAGVLERCLQYVTTAMDLRTKVWSWSLYSHFLIHSTYKINPPQPKW